GLWSSSDGGDTWNQVIYSIDKVQREEALPAPSLYDLVVIPGQPGGLLASVTDVRHVTGKRQDGIYRSVDGGHSWSRVHQFHCSGTDVSPAGQLAFAPDDPNLVYAAGGCVVAVSHNAGLFDWQDTPVIDAVPGSTIGGQVWHLAVTVKQS